MLELKKAEWFDSLKEFDSEIIKETLNDIKRTYQEDRDSYPDLLKFYSVAKEKSRNRQNHQEMAKRQREKAKTAILKNPIESAEVLRIKDEIRKLCGIKSSTIENISAGK
jgi:hypothetical protein